MSFSITVHVIVRSELMSLTLVCEPFNVAHTGINIAVALRQRLKERGQDPKLCVGITINNAANMVKAREVASEDGDDSMQRLSCFCYSVELSVHRFNGETKVKGASRACASLGGADKGPLPAGGDPLSGGVHPDPLRDQCWPQVTPPPVVRVLCVTCS